MESQNQHIGVPSIEGTSFFRTCINGLNALSGVGLLSIPFALSQGGWLSMILLFFVATITWYTGSLLGRCMNSNPLIKTYPDIGALAFGIRGRVFVSFFIYIELYLVAVEFLILEGDNLEKLFPNPDFNIFGVEIEGKPMFVMLSALVVLPTTWLKNLGILAYVSFGGVVASVILVLSVAWVGAVDGVGFNERDVLLKLEGLPTTISLFAFCYCGHAVFPMLCNSMKDRSQFSKVLVVCFAMSTITYGSMAILGYLMYGANLKSQITLNLPLQKISTKIAIYTTLINPLTKYATITNPIATAIEEAISPSCFCSTLMTSLLIRTLLVISTVIVALTIPFFAYVMAFIGAFLSVTGSILIPCLCYLKINKGAKRLGCEFMGIVGILVMGIFVGLTGTYFSVKEIVKLM